jgi:hypothetical protein
MPSGQEVSVRVLPRRRFYVPVLLASVVVIAGVEIASTDPADRRTERDLSRAASPHEANLRVVRSWRDTVKIRGRDEPRTVEIVFDSDAGVARRRIYDAGGDLVSDEELADQPQPSAEEIARAFSKVRADRELGSVLRRNRAELDGGFLLREAEGEPCGPGSRCLQVFMLSESRWDLLRRPVVDLKAERIAHPDLAPDRAN